MAKMNEMAKAPVVNTVAVKNDTKVALYKQIGAFICDSLDTQVDQVKPVKRDGKRTGSYGMRFEHEGQTFIVEIVAKNGAAPLENYGVEWTFEPDGAGDDQGETDVTNADDSGEGDDQGETDLDNADENE